MHFSGLCYSDIHAHKIEPADLLGRVFAVFFQPPAHRFSKAADCVVQAVLPRNIFLIGKLTVKDLIEILLEIPHKDLAALSRKNTLDALLFLLQVEEYVGDVILKTVLSEKS